MEDSLVASSCDKEDGIAQEGGKTIPDELITSEGFVMTAWMSGSCVQSVLLSTEDIIWARGNWEG